MILHIIFQIFSLVAGLALMVISLLVDAELTADKCQVDSKDTSTIVRLRKNGRIVLGLGTALTTFVITMIVYSFSKANAGVSSLNSPSAFVQFLYILSLIVMGSVALAIAGSMQKDIEALAANEENKTCATIAVYLKPLMTGGGIILGLGVLLLIYLIAAVAIGRKKAKKKKEKDQSEANAHLDALQALMKDLDGES